MISLENRCPGGIRIGVVAASGVDLSAYPEHFDERLDELLEERARGLSEEMDEWRRSVRDMLRNGRYKPTGRGKPASEYLLGAAAEGAFPRINAAVDICNYVSLRSLLPVSIWDLDRAGGGRYVARLGMEGESYVFNTAGQTISLEDLVVGAVVTESGPDGEAIVNPVKDSMKTKTNADTSRVAALVYGPTEDGPADSLEGMLALFGDLLVGCGPGATAASGRVEPGAVVRI